MTQRQLKKIKSSPTKHWVGDGFHVQTLFSYNDIDLVLSPFILLDYADPTVFAPNPLARRGVGPHPHKGFETVTIVYDGEVEHRDSAGAGGTISQGGVQWMTAASGIVHEEFHGKKFSENGGPFEMVQLWVNLSAKNKKAKAKYQDLSKDKFSTKSWAEGAGTLRVIAGSRDGVTGPAQTFSPMEIFDAEITGGSKFTFPVQDGWSLAILVRQGEIAVGNDQFVKRGELAVFETTGDECTIKVNKDSKILVLHGEPIREPVVGRGPFVMNTLDEVKEAYQEFASGKLGHLV